MVFAFTNYTSQKSIFRLIEPDSNQVQKRKCGKKDNGRRKVNYEENSSVENK